MYVTDQQEHAACYQFFLSTVVWSMEYSVIGEGVIQESYHTCCLSCVWLQKTESGDATKRNQLITSFWQRQGCFKNYSSNWLFSIPTNIVLSYLKEGVFQLYEGFDILITSTIAYRLRCPCLSYKILIHWRVHLRWQKPTNRLITKHG